MLSDQAGKVVQSLKSEHKKAEKTSRGEVLIPASFEEACEGDDGDDDGDGATVAISKGFRE